MPNHDGTGPYKGCNQQGEPSDTHRCCNKEQNQHRHGNDGGCCGKGKGHGEHSAQKDGCCQKHEH
ncbi:MAG: hypothetical protein VB062_06890 [Christensenella sp.]|nr:hypothetical protein [Christensenella sp.]